MIKSICFVMPNLIGGGAERVVSILANYFVKHNVEVTIILLKSLNIDYKLDSRIKLITKYAEKKVSPIQQIKIIRELMNEDSNRCFISFLPHQSIYTIIAGVFKKNKIIVSLRDDPKNIMHGNKLLQLIHNFLYIFADKIVFQTNDARDYFPKIVRKKSKVILNPITENLPITNMENNRKEIVSFCRLNKQKNLPMAIDAFSIFVQEFSDYKYIIYGKGEEEETLKKLIEDKNMNDMIEIRDFDKNIFNNVVNSSMFVLPSNHEGLSNAMLESMAMGLPTICTDCPIGGARMVIDSYENGILIPVGDRDSLLNAMKEVAKNKELATKMSSKAIKIREILSPDKICTEWYNVIDNCISKK